MTATLLVSGCADQERAPKYQVAVKEKIVPVRAEDLGVSEAFFQKIGVHLLNNEPTLGRFPAGLCVARVTAFTTEKGKQGKLRVTKPPVHHAIYWNHLLDELSAIREVVFLGKPGLDPRGYDLREVVEAAANLECSFCLIYAKLENSDADAEYVGVFWDTSKFKPLAVLRTPVVLPAEFQEESLQDENVEMDIGVCEADFRAEQDFRRLVRDVLWDMVARDQTAPTTQPSPWRIEEDDGLPSFPRDYERYRDSRYDRLWRRHRR